MFNKKYSPEYRTEYLKKNKSLLYKIVNFYFKTYKLPQERSCVEGLKDLSLDERSKDLFSEVWLAAYASFDNYEESKGKLSNWVYFAARSAAQSYVRSFSNPFKTPKDKVGAYVTSEFDEVIGTDEEYHPSLMDYAEERIDEKIELDRVREALVNLSELERQAFCAKYELNWFPHKITLAQPLIAYLQDIAEIRLKHMLKQTV
jgi:RNA polymerase sigma factor (sigma-70 family)